MKNTMIPSALAALVLGGLTSAARANITWDWSYTTSGVYYGDPVSGGGTLITDPLSGSSYQIIGITGTFAGNAITTLDDSFGGPDNTLYLPGGNGGGDSQVLSSDGFSFDDTTGDVVNIYDANMGAPNNYAAFDSNGSYSTTGTFTAALAPTPEPSQVISLLSLAGMGGAGLLLKLRRRK